MTKSTFFFYDLETSGLNAAYQRIMQFAGQRTDYELNPIGDPVNVLVRLTEDILPEPEAILITKTTPQQTQAEGMSEPELMRLLAEQVFLPNTTMVGFNNIRFDDEFMRFSLWRNFYDPYEWCYRDGRSRWDMLDVVRMTRALRPDGIIWPVDAKGEPTNRLEELSKANGLLHDQAHDALSDVTATIEVARLIKQTQPKLFKYLLDMRAKPAVAKLVNLANPQPFVYASGRYGKAKSFTTVALPIAPASRDGGALVYDLTVNPEPFLGLTVKQLKDKAFASWDERKKPDFVGLPVKELFYNKAPAVAPLGVMDAASWQRLKLDKAATTKHAALLAQNPDFSAKLANVYQHKPAFKPAPDVEGQLYDGFMPDQDKLRLEVVRAADEKSLATFQPEFVDQRLSELFVRYKARNYPKTLTDDERKTWETYRTQKFALTGPRFVDSLQKATARYANDAAAQFILEELRLWFESAAPLE